MAHTVVFCRRDVSLWEIMKSEKKFGNEDQRSETSRGDEEKEKEREETEKRRRNRRRSRRRNRRRNHHKSTQKHKTNLEYKN